MKLVLGRAQVQRQIAGTRVLQRLGIQTPPCRRRWRMSRSEEGWQISLELEYIPGCTALDFLRHAQLTPEVWRLLGHQVGRIVRKVAEAGYKHRDLKLSNFVISPENGISPDDEMVSEADNLDRVIQAQSWTIWVLDQVGVRRVLKRDAACIRMLDRLLVEPEEHAIPIPRAAWVAVLRELFTNLPRNRRRALFQQLRARRQR